LKRERKPKQYASYAVSRLAHTCKLKNTHNKRQIKVLRQSPPGEYLSTKSI